MVVAVGTRHTICVRAITKFIQNFVVLSSWSHAILFDIDLVILHDIIQTAMHYLVQYHQNYRYHDIRQFHYTAPDTEV